MSRRVRRCTVVRMNNTDPPRTSSEEPNSVKVLALYHGTRRALAPESPLNREGEYAYVSPNLDAAIWAGELAEGEEPARVYRVRATGPLEDTSEFRDATRSPYPTMTLRTNQPVHVIDEVTEWNHYHGTRADLRPGDWIAPGHAANFGPAPRTANFVYFTRTLDASIWGAELASGEGPGRIYLVEPSGAIEDDPNLTNARFKGNPTKSFRSRAPLRVIGEVLHFEGHPPEVIALMKEGLARLAEQGVLPEDD